MAAVVRFTPFDVSTAEGRSKERYRRVALGAGAAAATRAAAIAASFVSVPLTLRYLGTERYGLWITISSTIGMLAFADLGLNNGLLTVLAQAHGRDDRRTAQEAVSSAFVMLGAVAAAIGVFFAIAYPLVPWPRLFNVRTAQASREAGPAIAVLVACFLVNVPLGVVGRVQSAHQEMFASNLWQALGSVLGLCGLLVAIDARASLPWLVLAFAGAPAVAALANAVVVFGWQRAWIRPTWRGVRPSMARRLAASGALYLILQVAGAAAFQADSLVIARYLGADAVAQFAVPMKLFAVIPMLLGFVITPLWPAYGEAIARGEAAWVRRSYRRLIAVVLAVAVPAAAVLVLAAPWVISRWVGTSIAAPTILLVGLGLWAVSTSVTNVFAIVLNGAHVIGFQVVSATVMAVANVAISILLVRRIGVAGPVYGSLAAVSLFTIAPCLWYIPRIFSALKAASPGPRLAA